MWVALYFARAALLALAAAMGAMYYLNVWNAARLRWLDDHLAPAIVLAAVGCTPAEIVAMWQKRRAPLRALPSWEAALARWNRLRYCFFCDGVFSARTGTLVRPNQVETLLVEETTPAQIWRPVLRSSGGPSATAQLP
jgi:hypothetical protein